MRTAAFAWTSGRLANQVNSLASLLPEPQPFFEFWDTSSQGNQRSIMRGLVVMLTVLWPLQGRSH